MLQGIYSTMGCGLSRNMLIKGQFKIKDNLMEKKSMIWVYLTVSADSVSL